MCLTLLYGCSASMNSGPHIYALSHLLSPLNQIFTLLAKVFTDCHGHGAFSDSCHIINKAFVSSMAQIF